MTTAIAFACSPPFRVLYADHAATLSAPRPAADLKKAHSALRAREGSAATALATALAHYRLRAVAAGDMRVITRLTRQEVDEMPEDAFKKLQARAGCFALLARAAACCCVPSFELCCRCRLGWPSCRHVPGCFALLARAAARSFCVVAPTSLGFAKLRACAAACSLSKVSCFADLAGVAFAKLRKARDGR